ncbi:hypothetical protein F2P81_024552 [Scophthalmus maximus]|uniref:Kinetochore-associated protein NSL1-like n=1 Tax=Scophthalmus maximus TaxID=52904 RepID=A0A6A4RXU6_SCOMX|nr:hypothetical protein F2P81_024552 [Scophthalmus maximus]
METSAGGNSPDGETNREYRVRVASKKQVVEQMNKYGNILKTALDGQTHLAEEARRLLLQELLANFEAAVQDNVSVNGQTWEEAPEVTEDEAVDLESLLDDTIVETTRRRRTYPRQILPHVVHSLKAERKLMGLYEHVVKPREVWIKGITLQKQAEGLCEILDMKPSHASLEIHREVFGHRDDRPDAPPAAAARDRRPIKRAVEDAAAADGYVPLAKKPDGTPE